MIAGPMLLFTCYGLTRTAWLSLFGEQAAGVVTGTVSRSDPNGSSTAPRVRFVDQQGREHFVEGALFLRTSMDGDARSSHAEAETVRVFYPKGRPDRAIITDGKTIIWQLLLTLFLVLPVGIGVWLIRSDPDGWDDGWEPG
jgi:hypothetical protein